MLIPCAILLSLATAAESQPQIQRYGSSFSESAVLVENAALAHTAQLIAADRTTATVDEELRDVFDQLSELLAEAGSSRADVVKLNLYVADSATGTAAMDFLSTWCPVDGRPAVATVVTALPRDRRFAADAVFVIRNVDDAAEVVHRVRADGGSKASGRTSHVSILPRGDVVYVSGQAEPGDLATATRATLGSLLETLEFLQLERSDIVRVKCFLQPMSEVDTVDRAIAEFFGDDRVPAVSHVEWMAGSARPIEIELVAAAPSTETTDTVSYFTPPGLRPSPVFSRVARIHGNRRIYVSGLTADGGDAAEQVHAIFQKLIRLLKPVRSNLRHLGKATYYVADDDLSARLNEIRPHYYDPQRPPAASKAMVSGTGSEGRTISVDIIAAPETPLHSVLTPLAEPLEPTRRVVYRTVGERKLQLHIFEPDRHRSSDQRPVFLAIHGGGWTGGTAESFYPFASHFADLGMLGISLDYRLMSPQQGTTVFDCVSDARSAVRWIRQNADALGIDPTRIVVMGGSAGGHLAVSTALFDDANDGDNDDNDVDVSARPDALVLMYPVIDTSAEGYGQAKIGDRWRELSPLHNVRGGLPPALIFHGTADAVTPYVGAKTFHELSTAAGNDSVLVTHPGGRHGYLIFDRDEYDRALGLMEEFLRQQKFLPSE